MQSGEISELHQQTCSPKRVDALRGDNPDLPAIESLARHTVATSARHQNVFSTTAINTR